MSDVFAMPYLQATIAEVFFVSEINIFANQDVIKSLLCSKAKDITLFPHLAHLLSYL